METYIACTFERLVMAMFGHCNLSIPLLEGLLYQVVLPQTNVTYYNKIPHEAKLYPEFHHGILCFTVGFVRASINMT